ncbi:bacterio-opsin activator domain-containing protein [Halomarina rubra]|uniref:Bacterio-opsin activator domain-containing protein n=1 Tax=Halomarina rubra TaxID=2071873 RepID=A0ABD6AWY7_9EURY|nr:bacterio-opsin activator domain-containing protein [Halomarina rubra]
MPADALDVLLIEDNPGDVRLIEEMLSEATTRTQRPAGQQATATQGIRHASRLEEGLDSLEEHAFDVMLLDLGLPESTGIDTLETVRERSQNIPIVVLTGHNDERVGDQAVQQGAQEYLIKDELTPALLQRSLRHAIERKDFQRTQTALHRASRDVIQAESKPEASRLVLDAAVDVLELSGIVVFLFDDSTNVLRPAATTDELRSLVDDLGAVGSEEPTATWESFVTGETIALDDVLDTDYSLLRETSVRSGLWIPLGNHGVIAIVSETTGGFDQQTVMLADNLAATAEATLDRIEREEALREHERELTERNSQLEALNRTNELIREIDQVLVQTTTREAIEQAVCERLTQEDRFAFAWIGDVVDERLRPRTWAGNDQGYLDVVSLTTEDAAGPPSVIAATSEAATVVTNVASDLRGAPWRKAALARNFGSAISVPLSYGDLSYGVLTVYTTEPDGFDERSKETFEELGETIANAINSVQTRQALLSDTVVELELAIDEPDDLLGRLARETDCEITFDGIVPQADETTRLFFTAHGAAAESVEAVAGTIPSVDHLECISTTGDGGDCVARFVIAMSGMSIPSQLIEYGAIARSIIVTATSAQVVVELPESTDVRSFVNWFEQHYPDTDLIARRDKERNNDSQQAFGAALSEQLTDRQLEALKTAFHSGYFEWPRDRTGQEVAESLSITQPTFNGHLRAAERKLCAMLFSGDSA